MAENGLDVDRRGFLAGATLGAGAATLLAGGPALAQAEFPSAAAEAEAEAAIVESVGRSSETAGAAVARLADPILRISREVWATPELSLEEVRSAEIHVRELRAAGFTIVSIGTSGTPTAFLAEWSQGSGGAKVGFLPEYDALPGLGNAAEARQVAGPTGAEVGHGCGHNMLGAGCTGGAMALKAMMETAGTPGTIRVYGCAAEETDGVKVFMARDGLFDDLDACLAWHPAPVAGTGALRTAANNRLRVTFHGRTAHAGNSPWDGRSALKAAELFGHGVNLMREHVRPTARIHYIYGEAGVAANIVPDRALMWMTVRDVSREQVNAMTEWAQQVANGAAMATQTKAEFTLMHGMYDLLPNDALFTRAHRHLMATPLEWTAAEQDFARACQREMGLAENGLATSVLPLLGELTTGGSSDVGDVSYRTPTALFGWPTMPLGTSLHTWAVTACGGMSIGDKGALSAARVLAGVGFDVMTDPALREAARADFVRRLGDTVFVSPIPPDRTAPLGWPAMFIKTGDDEVIEPLVEEDG